MPTFETPEPISVTLELPVSEVRIVASDRDTTIVTIHGGDGADPADAAGTRVEFVNGQLLIKGPPQRGWAAKWGLGFLGLGWGGAENIEIALPSGSRVQAEMTFGGVTAEGRLGPCRLRTGFGDIRLDRTGPADLKTTSGDIVVEHVEGHAEIDTNSGEVRVRTIEGTATIANEHGEIGVSRISGELRMNGSYGDMAVDHAAADVEVKTAYGSVRIGAVVRGAVTFTSTYGHLDIGVGDGTAAWLDVSSSTGKLRNHLDARHDPEGFAETVEIRAHTRDGDITIRRA